MAAKQQLTTYQRKRDFAHTPEPAGAARPVGNGDARRFVVQRHRARRLHYDFRLEIDGVLVSWAVPKGPTLDPDVKRAAFHVEDHPIEYLNFEGVIPAGQYGGGDVIVWDAGRWEPHKVRDPGRALRSGELHLDLHGEKLRGRFVLVRTGGAAERENWLLLHKHDEAAVKGWDAEQHPKSVLSGRTNDEVQADPDRMWRSDLPAAAADVALKPAAATDDELAALDELPKSGTWTIFGRDVHVTDLDKVLFPARTKRGRPITKRELLRYSAQLAPIVLPYLKQRAITLHRFPNGVDGKGFWQKQLPSRAPDWLPRWDNPRHGSNEAHTYLVIDEPAALVWAANFGGLEWHPWASQVDAPDQPTYALIDLDPGTSTSWADLVTLARLHRTALDHLGVRAYPQVTGRRGIQIWVPVKRGPDFAKARAWVDQLCAAVADVAPELVSRKRRVAERGGRARVAYPQNAINKTLVAPYSPRATAGAPVAAPIEWDELDDPKLRPDRWTIRTVLDRIADQGELFRPLLDASQQLPTIE